MCHFRPSLQRWKFRRRGALRSNKVSTFFNNCIRMSSFPSLAHRALFLSQNLVSLVMSKRDHFLNSMGKLRSGLGRIGFDNVNEDKWFPETVFQNNYVTSCIFWSQNSLFLASFYFLIGLIFAKIRISHVILCERKMFYYWNIL